MSPPIKTAYSRWKIRQCLRIALSGKGENKPTLSVLLPQDRLLTVCVCVCIWGEASAERQFVFECGSCVPGLAVLPNYLFRIRIYPRDSQD